MNWFKKKAVEQPMLADVREIHEDGPIVFIISWGRPIYLWSCLDSLFRLTKSPCRFVLIDNFSGDPIVTEVIEAFQRRNLFHAVHRFETNSRGNWISIWNKYIDTIGPVYFQIESDVEIVAPTDECWLARMYDTFRRYPKTGMLGSLIDTVDFVDEKYLSDATNKTERFLVKADSPERLLNVDGLSGEEFVITKDPLGINNPPGRLLALDAAMMKPIGPTPDHDLGRYFFDKGYQPGISGKVLHRHLSLLNYFDYPNYSENIRDSYIEFKAE